MKAPGNFYPVLISTVFIAWRIQDVTGGSVAYVNTGALLTLNFIFVSSLSIGPPTNVSVPHNEIPGKNSSEVEKRIRSSLRRRVVRQFGFIAPALQTVGCLPKLFCGLNSKEPSDGTSTINDLSYLMKFAFSDQLDELDDEDGVKKGKDGHKDEDGISDESLEHPKAEYQMLEDQANEELIYDDPHYLSFIWKDMMDKEKKLKKKIKEKQKEHEKPKKKRKPRRLELELDILLKTLEIDKNFNKFSTHFQKFRDIFQSNRQSRSEKTLDDPNFNVTEYIQSKNQQLTETIDNDKKLEVAVEAGGKLRSGRQCRLLFNNCPYTVEQMKAMIKASNKSQSILPPDIKQTYNGKPLKDFSSSLHVKDPLHSYMTDDVYVDNLDSEHHLEIQKEEIEKMKEKEKKTRPNVSLTKPPVSTYDESAQLLYLMLPESEIEMHQKYHAAMQAAAAAEAGHTNIKSTEDDEANDQIIPQLHVDYTRPYSKPKDSDEDKEKSSEEVASKESQEIATDQSPENDEFILSPIKNKIPVESKEEQHDDEVSVVKEEKNYMTTTKRPKFKYRIRNRNKNKETGDEKDNNEESSVSEQDDGSEEQIEEKDYKETSTEKLLNGNTAGKSNTPLPPVFGEIKDTTESSTDYSTSTSSQKTTTTEEYDGYDGSDEGPSILPSKFHRPYPYRGNKRPNQQTIVKDDEKDVPKEPPRIPIVNIGGNNKYDANKYQAPPLPAPPPIYSKFPNSHNNHPEPLPNHQNNFPEQRPNPQNYHPEQRPNSQYQHPEQRPNSHNHYLEHRPNSHNQRPKIQSMAQKKHPPSLLSSILNFKIVAPKKRPTRRPRPGQSSQGQSNRPQRPPATNNNKEKRKEPFRRPTGAMSILGGIKNVLNRPISKGKRPVPPPPPIYNGKHPQNSRPIVRKPPGTGTVHGTGTRRPEIQHPVNDDVSSEEENESNGNEADKSAERPQNFDLSQLPQLGNAVKKEEPPNPDVAPPPVFGMVKPDVLTELMILKDQVATQSDGNEQDEPDNLNENNRASAERGESGSTEEDKYSEEYIAQNNPLIIRLPSIGSDSPSQNKETSPPPPPPQVFSKWKPPSFGHSKLPPSKNNNHQSPFLKSKSKQQLNTNSNIKGSAELENSLEEEERSSEENEPEDDGIQIVSSVGIKRKPFQYKINPKNSGQNSNKNETTDSSEEQEEDKSSEKNKDSEEQNDGDGSREDAKNDGSEESEKKNSTEDKEDVKKSSEDNVKNSAEDDDNVKSKENGNHKSEEEQKSEEGSSEEVEVTNNKVPEIIPTRKPTKLPEIEIATFGTPILPEESAETVLPPPPPVKIFAPSPVNKFNLADEIQIGPEVVTIDKVPVAYNAKPSADSPLKPLPPTNPPRPITNTMVRSTPSPQQAAQQAASSGGMGMGMGDGGNQNPQGNRNKNNRNKKKKQNEKDKEKSSEEKDSDEDSGEDDDEEDDSPETSSEEVQDDGLIKTNKRNPVRRVVQKFQFPNIGNAKPAMVESPPKIAIALPPIFKWRARSGQSSKRATNQRKGNDPNENENGYPTKVYKLSLSSEESSKSSSASIESIKAESSRHERREMVSDTNNNNSQELVDDDGSEEQEKISSNNSNTNHHNSQSQEIDSSRLEYKPRPRSSGGGESTIMISNKKRQFYSQPQSKKSQRGESQRRKAEAPLPPIFGKVGR